MAREEIAEAIEFGDHGTTFGGNPLVCAASLATIEAIEEENLLEAAEEKGAWFRKQIEALNLPSLKMIRGMGLMIGLVMDFETKPLVLKMLEKGVLANATAGNVIRIVPPLTIGYEELQQVVSVIESTVLEYTEIPA
jgi:acetylornithine/N-succinyldiaminopimelate aminotransferase